MRKGTDFLLRLKPWSAEAFAVALLAAIVASILQEAIATFGITLHFAMAGAPAGCSVAAIAIPIVWWEFLPPQFEFSPLNGDDYHHFAIFLVSGGLAISACSLYREALAILRR